MNHEAFNNFIEKYKLSNRRFALLAGQAFVSKTSVSRLRGENGRKLSLHYIREIEPVLLETINRFLTGLGRTADEINEELRQIFEDLPIMITTRTTLDYDVLDFFKLKRDPFALESDPRSSEESFSNKNLEQLARRIEDAINYQGFLGVLGQVGAGKSALKNRVVDKTRKSGKAHFLFPKFAQMDKVNAGSIVHFLLEYFGQKPRHRLVQAQTQLENFLSELHERGERVCLGFDECHRLADATLTALKNFYELGTGGYDRYLGLVLFGQPQFEKRLYAVDFREIAERLEIVKMPAMSKSAHDYIAHRLQLVGGDIDDLFEKRAVELIASQVETPLGIGNLANKALMSAYEKGEEKVLARFVEKDIEPTTRRVATGKFRNDTQDFAETKWAKNSERSNEKGNSRSIK